MTCVLERRGSRASDGLSEVPGRAPAEWRRQDEVEVVCGSKDVRHGSDECGPSLSWAAKRARMESTKDGTPYSTTAPNAPHFGAVLHTQKGIFSVGCFLATT